MKHNLKHHKKHGFKTPDTYFESFDDKVFGKLSDDKLDQGIDSGFKTPEGYFESLDHSILESIKSEPKVITLKPNPKLYYLVGIAASLILFFAIYINIENTPEISAEMVETYFQDSDLDSYELAELLSDAELLEDDFIITETNYNEDNLEDYLLEHSDIEELLQ